VSLILSAVLSVLSLATMTGVAFTAGVVYNRRTGADSRQQLQLCREQAAESRRLMRARIETLLQREQLCEERETQLADKVRLHEARLRQIERLADSLGMSRMVSDSEVRVAAIRADLH